MDLRVLLMLTINLQVRPCVLPAGQVGGHRGTGDGQTEAPPSRGMAPQAPRGLRPYGHRPTPGHPHVRAPGLLQDHDCQGPGYREWAQLPGCQGWYGVA